MKIHLMKLNKGFIEDLGDHPDFSIEIENFAFDRWLEDREAEDRIGKYVTIMPMVNFEQMLQLPLGMDAVNTNTPVKDRYPRITMILTNLYTVGAAHAECSHVMFIKKFS